MTLAHRIVLASFALLACRHSTTVPNPACGMSPTDWCSAPAGDPCGVYKNVESCRADARCGGMPYRGESVVACQLDTRGFGTNCPTVGCVSLPR